MRLYPIQIDKLATGIVGTIFTVLLMIISVLLVDYVGFKYGFEEYYYLVDAHKILAVACAILAFIMFKNINIGKKRQINWISASTFGVLLIHTNSDIMRNFLWINLFKNKDYYHSPYLVIHAISVVTFIFIFGLFIDKIRIACIERPLFKWIDKWKWDKAIQNNIVKGMNENPNPPVRLGRIE